MNDFILGGLFAFIITTLLLPLIIGIARKYKVFTPENHRRIHSGEISSLGGIAVFLGVAFSIIVFVNLNNINDYKYVFLSLSVLFLLGLNDDFFDIKPIYKFVAQISVALFLVFFEDLYFVLNIANLSLNQNFFLSLIISIIFIVLIINAYNFMDGVDLLASLIAWLIMIPLGLWFYLNSQIYFGGLLFAFGGALLSFMLYNFSPAKIFLGDMGTMVIGLLLAIAFIKFVNLNLTTQSIFHLEKPFSVIFAIFSLPIIDLFRVSFLRILNKKTPWTADKNHIHHLLLKIGLKQNYTSFLIALILVFSFLTNYKLSEYVDSEVLLILINAVLISIIIFSIQIFSNKKSNSYFDKPQI